MFKGGKNAAFANPYKSVDVISLQSHYLDLVLVWEGLCRGGQNSSSLWRKGARSDAVCDEGNGHFANFQSMFQKQDYWPRHPAPPVPAEVR